MAGSRPESESSLPVRQNNSVPLFGRSHATGLHKNYVVTISNYLYYLLLCQVNDIFLDALPLRHPVGSFKSIKLIPVIGQKTLIIYILCRIRGFVFVCVCTSKIQLFEIHIYTVAVKYSLGISFKIKSLV